jgi:hypothetical protein
MHMQGRYIDVFLHFVRQHVAPPWISYLDRHGQSTAKRSARRPRAVSSSLPAGHECARPTRSHRGGRRSCSYKPAVEIDRPCARGASGADMSFSFYLYGIYLVSPNLQSLRTLC